MSETDAHEMTSPQARCRGGLDPALQRQYDRSVAKLSWPGDYALSLELEGVETIIVETGVQLKALI